MAKSIQTAIVSDQLKIAAKIKKETSLKDLIKINTAISLAATAANIADTDSSKAKRLIIKANSIVSGI